MTACSRTVDSLTARSADRTVAGPVLAVAYSGGLDSSALLHAALAQALPLGLGVVALHVHHGLHPQADEWLRHCRNQCTDWAQRGWPVRFAAHRVVLQPGAGESVESWARSVRYRALQDMSLRFGANLVLLAHHRRDQAETFLLQALRGAGVHGLAAMPIIAQRGGVTWARPWLRKPREEIERYVRQHHIEYVDDDSNADVRFARNRLRRKVWPVLEAEFAQAELTLATAAEWAQEASDCLSDLAELDLASMDRFEGGLDLKAWFSLSESRRSNSLRLWLRRTLGFAASASLVSRLMSELSVSGSRRWPTDSGELWSYRGRLRVVTRPVARGTDPRPTVALAIDRVGDFPVAAWGGRLRVSQSREGGVPLAWLGCAELRSRLGSEQFQSGANRPPRSLKKQFQSTGVPSWERDVPLLFSGGQLVFVPGLGVDARVRALPGQPQVDLQWIPDAVG